MENYNNQFPHPYPYPYPNPPPPNHDPYRPSAPSAPPYLLPSNSFNSSPIPHHQQFNQPYQSQYPTPPYFPPPYDPHYINPHPNPSYPYPPPIPYNPPPPHPISHHPSFQHHHSFSSHHPPPQDHTPHIQQLLANTHLSDPPPAAAHDWQIVPANNQTLQPSLKVLLLHGSLDIYVLEARNLPNMDMFSKTLSDMVGGRLTNSISSKLEHMSPITSDPYVSITLSGATVGRTYVVSNSEYPVWMQHFYVPVAHHAAEVLFVVKDNDIVGSQLIGSVSIPAEWIYSGEKVEGVYPIVGSNGKPCKPGATLKLSIQYIAIEKHGMYYQGVGAGLEYGGVAGTYFPLRKGGKVTLYQDANVPDGCLLDLKLDRGAHYEHGKCWRDIFEGISQARRLIYIAGWSVFHTVKLVRDAGCGSDCTLGSLLKSKSQEGVRVLLLVWDDPTSRNILGYQIVCLLSFYFYI